MVYLVGLTPIAFVFAIGAMVQVSSLKKEPEKMNEELKKMGDLLLK